MTTRMFATLCAAVATLAATAPAEAAPNMERTWTYSATVKGEGSFAYGWAQPAYEGQHVTRTENLSFRWSTKIKRAVLGKRFVVRSTSAPTRITNVDAKSTMTMPLAGGGATTGACTGNTATAGESTLGRPFLASLVKVDIALLHFKGGIQAPMTCTGTMGASGGIAVNNVKLSPDAESEPLTLDFHIPREALGSGKIIEIFDEELPCPQPPDPHRTACSMHLKGEMVLRKLSGKRKRAKK